MNKTEKLIKKLKFNDSQYFQHVVKLKSIYKINNLNNKNIKNKNLSVSVNKYKLEVSKNKQKILEKENKKFAKRLANIKSTKNIKENINHNYSNNICLYDSNKYQKQINKENIDYYKHLFKQFFN